MSTKVIAAAAATSAGINTVVMNGVDPENIFRLIDGEKLGTLFTAVEGTV